MNTAYVKQEGDKNESGTLFITHSVNRKSQEDQPCKLPTFLVNVHLCAFKFIQLSPNHSLTQVETQDC